MRETTTTRGGGRRSTRRSQARAERRRRLRRTVLGLVCAAGAAGVAVALLQQDPPDGKGGKGGTQAALRPAPAAPSPTRSAASPPAASPSTPAAGPSRASRGDVPRSGPGTFTAAKVSAGKHGKGPARRYRVEVEDGSGVDADQAAREVDAVLADERGWIRDDRYGFQLTAQGGVDFTVRIATPQTTDRLCEVTTPELVGETNCRAGHTVVVNLKRWQQGSPNFDGPVSEYRALIINHEVGHEIGRGHETCPGAGKPAPAMMQQLKGLQGCKANAWPYDRDGKYLSGPAVP
ncbi:DUF3152 domain-containing protein [Streptomyces sp. NPDC048603]|uniref:DUF3152 domain-containing protein n=1 Tax=Streptomyces sp. NPDC048603 TaxID=3365577 RepID=UPI003723E096